MEHVHCNRGICLGLFLVVAIVYSSADGHRFDHWDQTERDAAESGPDDRVEIGKTTPKTTTTDRFTRRFPPGGRHHGRGPSLRRDPGLRVGQWRRQHGADRHAKSMRRYLSRHRHRLAAHLRRALQREARRHSVWKHILRKVDAKHQHLFQGGKDERNCSTNPKLKLKNSDGLKSKLVYYDDDDGDDVDGSDFQQKPKMEDEVASMSNVQEAKSDSSVVPRQRLEDDDPFVPFLDRKQAVNFFSREPFLSNQGKWLRKLFGVKPEAGTEEINMEDGDLRGRQGGGDTFPVTGDFDDGADDEDSEEDMFDSHESASEDDDNVEGWGGGTLAGSESASLEKDDHGDSADFDSSDYDSSDQRVDSRKRPALFKSKDSTRETLNREMSRRRQWKRVLRRQKLMNPRRRRRHRSHHSKLAAKQSPGQRSSSTRWDVQRPTSWKPARTPPRQTQAPDRHPHAARGSNRGRQFNPWRGFPRKRRTHRKRGSPLRRRPFTRNRGRKGRNHGRRRAHSRSQWRTSPTSTRRQNPSTATVEPDHRSGATEVSAPLTRTMSAKRSDTAPGSTQNTPTATHTKATANSNGKTARRPDGVTSQRQHLADLSEEKEDVVAGVGVGPDLTPDRTLYLGTVEGRKVQTSRLDIPGSGSDSKQAGPSNASPDLARASQTAEAAPSLKRGKRNASDDSDEDNDGDADDSPRLARRRHRARRWRSRNRHQRRNGAVVVSGDADNDDDDDDTNDDDGDSDVSTASSDGLTPQERRRLNRRRNRRRERINSQTGHSEGDDDHDNPGDDSASNGSVGFVQVRGGNGRRGGSYHHRRAERRRHQRRRNRQDARRRNRQQRRRRQRVVAASADVEEDVDDDDTDDDSGSRVSSQRPLPSQFQTINNNDDNNGSEEPGAHIRSPFINHRTAYDFLSTQARARSRTPGHGRGDNEQRAEQWQFTHTMSESLCEVFDKHFIPTSVGGRCE